MEEVIFVIPVGALIAVFVWVTWSKSQKAELVRLAEVFGLTWHRPTLLIAGYYDGRIDGVQVHLQTANAPVNLGGQSNSYVFTAVIEDGETISIRRRGNALTRGIRLGDREFDRHVRLKGDAARLHACLDAETRVRVAQAVCEQPVLIEGGRVIIALPHDTEAAELERGLVLAADLALRLSPGNGVMPESVRNA